MIYFHKFLHIIIIVNWKNSFGVHVTFEDGYGIVFSKEQWNIISSMYEFIGEI
jgi:hypothetical protein